MGVPQPAQSDEELARRARDGDEEAARTLFDRHADELRARVRRRLPPKLRAKVGESDVVQETCLAAFLSLDTFDACGDGAFKGWLLKILERKVIDQVRRFAQSEKREVGREVSAGTSVIRMAGTSGDPSPSAAAIGAEDRVRLTAAKARLAEPYREILRLVYDEHRPLEDAGAQLGRSAEAARKLHARAVLALADEMQEGGAGPG